MEAPLVPTHTLNSLTEPTWWHQIISNRKRLSCFNLLLLSLFVSHTHNLNFAHAGRPTPRARWFTGLIYFPLFSLHLFAESLALSGVIAWGVEGEGGRLPGPTGAQGRVLRSSMWFSWLPVRAEPERLGWKKKKKNYRRDEFVHVALSGGRKKLTFFLENCFLKAPQTVRIYAQLHFELHKTVLHSRIFFTKLCL